MRLCLGTKLIKFIECPKFISKYSFPLFECHSTGLSISSNFSDSMSSFTPAFPPLELSIRSGKSSDAKFNRSDHARLPHSQMAALASWFLDYPSPGPPPPKSFLMISYQPERGAVRRTYVTPPPSLMSEEDMSLEGTIQVPRWVLDNLGWPSGCQGTRCEPPCDSSCDLHPCEPHPNAPCPGRCPELARVTVSHVLLPTVGSFALHPLCKTWERVPNPGDILTMSLQGGQRSLAVAGQTLMLVAPSGAVWRFRVTLVRDSVSGEEVPAASFWYTPEGACAPEMTTVSYEEHRFNSTDAGVMAPAAPPPGSAKIPTLMVRG